jgi:hypothetical protein
MASTASKVPSCCSRSKIDMPRRRSAAVTVSSGEQVSVGAGEGCCVSAPGSAGADVSEFQDHGFREFSAAAAR